MTRRQLLAPTQVLESHPTSESLKTQPSADLTAPQTPAAKAMLASPTGSQTFDSQPQVTPISTHADRYPEAVFTIDHGPPEVVQACLKQVLKNFSWKSHYLIGEFRDVYTFMDESGTLDVEPSPSSFPLRVLKGQPLFSPCQVPVVLDPKGSIRSESAATLIYPETLVGSLPPAPPLSPTQAKPSS